MSVTTTRARYELFGRLPFHLRRPARTTALASLGSPCERSRHTVVSRSGKARRSRRHAGRNESDPTLHSYFVLTETPLESLAWRLDRARTRPRGQSRR